MHTCHHITIPFVKVNPRITFFLIFFRISAFYLLPNGVKMGYSLSKSNFMAEMYYMIGRCGEVPRGPYTRAMLQTLAERGELGADAQVSVVGQAEWVPYSQLPPVPPCPPTYKIWSMVSIFFCFPFSIVAVNRSYRVENLYAQGLYAEAQSASVSALKWNLFFSVLGVIVLIFCWYAFCHMFESWQKSNAGLLKLIRHLI